MTASTLSPVGLSLPLPILAADQSPAVTPNQGAVVAALQRLVASRQTPGLQYAFLSESGVQFSTQAGLADVAGSRPVQPVTSFHGYSVTKTFTAAAIVGLALAGRLDLEGPLRRYLPELDDPRSPTLRQVLAHTGGYKNPIPLAWSHRADDSGFDAAAFFQRIAGAYGRAAQKPGTHFAYSNVGYLLLGEVIARVTGQPYPTYIEEVLLQPLRLGSGELLSFDRRAMPDHARGYIRRMSLLNALLGLFIDRREFMTGSHGGWSEFSDLLVDGAAYGGLLGNAAGFARYLQALLRNDSPFPSPLTQRLFTGQKTLDGRDIPMALGWFRGALGGEAFFDHAGGGGGYYCELRIYPRLRRASVLLCNRTGIKNDRLLDELDPPLLTAGGR